ncbi:MAG: tRNA (adenosine(37)-N6)-threonylcarbamoyltransferase complex dimerization subunit type 1 TsaB [bacterium]
MILALDTTTRDGSVALATGGRVFERRFDPRGDGAVAALADLLAEHGVSPGEIEAVGVAVGPGSFTGVRIGVSAAQGFCRALSIPAVPVGTLDGLAALARESDWGVPGTLILASVDARRAEVYAALYRVPEDGGDTARLWGPEAISCLSLAERFARTRPEDRSVAQGVLVGDGAALLAPLFPEESGWEAPERLRHTSAAAVARAAERRLRSGGGVAAADLDPVYLRKSDAEVRREGRDSHESPAD